MNSKADAAAPASAASAGEVGALISASPIPFRQAEAGDMPAGTAVALWAIIGLALLGGFLVMLKRRAPGASWLPGKSRSLQVTERCSLTPGTQLVVAHYGGRRLLLSVGPAGTQLLRDDAEATAP